MGTSMCIVSQVSNYRDWAKRPDRFSSYAQGAQRSEARFQTIPTQLRALGNLGVFVVFSVTYLDAPIKWNHLVGFGLIVAAAFFIFLD
jgi:hypothetical protein